MRRRSSATFLIHNTYTMKYSLRLQDIELTDEDQRLMDSKLDRIKKHLTPPYVADISCIRTQLKTAGETVTCIINIEQGKKVFHAERTSDTIQNALDEAVAAVSRELAKEHDKQKRHGGGVQR